MSSRRIQDVATSVMTGKRASTFPGPYDWMYAEGFCKGQTLREESRPGRRGCTVEAGGLPQVVFTRLGPSAVLREQVGRRPGRGPEFLSAAAALGLVRGAGGREREGSRPGGVEQQQEALELEEGSRDGRGSRGK